MSELLIWWRCWWDSSSLCLVFLFFFIGSRSIIAMPVYVAFIRLFFISSIIQHHTEYPSFNCVCVPFVDIEIFYGCVAVTKSFNFRNRNKKLKSYSQWYRNQVLGIQINNFTRPIVNLFRILIKHPRMNGWMDDMKRRRQKKTIVSQ